MALRRLCLLYTSFTEAATAVFGAYFKLQSFIFMPCFGLNNAMVPIVSFNYGAQKFDRVRRAVRLTSYTAIGIMCVGFALLEFIPETLLGLFSPTEEMLSIGRAALRIIGIHFPLAGFSIIAGSACQALGKPTYALVSSVCRQIVVLLPAAYLLSLTGRLELVWLSFPIAEIVSVIMNLSLIHISVNEIARHEDILRLRGSDRRVKALVVLAKIFSVQVA